MNRVVGRLGPSGRAKACRRSAVGAAWSSRRRTTCRPRRSPTRRAGILHAGGPAAAPPAGWQGAAADLVLRTGRGGTRPPCGLLAVLRGVVLHEAVDELI